MGDALLRRGCGILAEPAVNLLSACDETRRSMDDSGLNPQTHSLNKDLAGTVSGAIDDWSMGGKVRRLWAGDSTLWTGSDEGNWLGWLTVTQET